MDFRLGELFSGPGGLGLGAKMASFNHNGESHSISHAWATDYDRDTCSTYRKNIGDSKSVVCQDIRKLKFDSLRNISDVDALAFGFPCNDFSIVGKQKGIDGVYGPLYQYCVDAVDYFRPKWFVAENVAGLRNANEGEAFRTILDEFSALGYQVYPHLYKFDQYGVPQTRHRIIIVGIANEYEFSFLPSCPSYYKNSDISAQNALENPPIPATARAVHG